MEGKRLLTYFFSCGLLMCLSGAPSPSEASFFHKSTYSQDSIQKRIVKEAKEQGVCPYLALSIAKQESGFDCNARSPVGAIGLFQLMPDTARELNVNPHDVNENIHGGVKYLKVLTNQFGSRKLTVAAYNAGPGAVSQYGGVPPYPETKNYVRNVMQYYYEYSGNPSLVSNY
jgi:soluble lytic murein transglycosylase-like protein